MLRLPPGPTRPVHSFPNRRSSDLRTAVGDSEGMKFSVMPHAKRDDRRIEATGNPYEDRGELRGPRRDAIEDNLPKGIEVGSLTIDAGPRGPNDRLFGPPLYNLQRHPR